MLQLSLPHTVGIHVKGVPFLTEGIFSPKLNLPTGLLPQGKLNFEIKGGSPYSHRSRKTLNIPEFLCDY